MTKNDVIKRLKEYLDNYNISYETAVDNGYIQLRMEFQADNSPDQMVEACGFIRSVRNYTATIVHWERCFAKKVNTEVDYCV